MELIFVCPETDAVFRSRNFDITENNGVQTDSSGNKYLDAKVVLKHPCPVCGRMHVYPAGELSCPFGNLD